MAVRPAEAHPLGNFTTNHLVRVRSDGTVLRLRYVLDLAEIPAFSVERGLDPSAHPGPAALARWGRAEAATILAGLAVERRRPAAPAARRAGHACASARARPGCTPST